VVFIVDIQFSLSKIEQAVKEGRSCEGRKKDGRERRDGQKAECVCVWVPHCHMFQF